jgi:hypothetical protein
MRTSEIWPRSVIEWAGIFPAYGAIVHMQEDSAIFLRILCHRAVTMEGALSESFSVQAASEGPMKLLYALIT